MNKSVFSVRFRSLLQFCKNFFLYYVRYPRFFCAEILLFCVYFWESCYRIARLYDEKGGEVGPYGEMDLSQFAYMMKMFQISSENTFVDLGFGRGRVVFFAQLVLGHRAVFGVEKISVFVKRAQKIGKALGLNEKMFAEKDFTRCSSEELLDKIPKEKKVCLYMYNLTCPEEKLLFLKGLPEGSLLITISEAISLPCFSPVQSVNIQSPWGETEAFLQEKQNL